MNRYLYKIITEDGYHIEHRFEQAKRYFDQHGVKMYAYTKNLKPTYILMYWKKDGQ